MRPALKAALSRLTDQDRTDIERKLADADAEIARFSSLSNPLPPSQAAQFQRSLDALLSRPKLARQLKEI